MGESSDDDVPTVTSPGVRGRAPESSDDEEESVTARSPSAAGDAYQGEESVTVHGVAHLLAPIDETEGTTKKVRKSSAEGGALPSAWASTLRSNEGREIPQLHTVVMRDAPLKPSDLGADLKGGATSDSGLRIERPQGNAGERASLGALGFPTVPGPSLGAGPPFDVAGRAQPPFPQPAAPAERKPPYLLVVGVVAVVSIIVPIVLFLLLRRATSDAPSEAGPATSVASPPSRR